MFTKNRRQRHSKKKIAVYLFSLIILGTLILIFYIFIVSKRPLYISPMGKANVDLAYIQKVLNDNKIPFSQVSISGNFCEINVRNNGKVVLSLNKNVGKQVASLQRILRELTIEGKPFKSIDFRFTEPIMSFN